MVKVRQVDLELVFGSQGQIHHQTMEFDQADHTSEFNRICKGICCILHTGEVHMENLHKLRIKFLLPSFVKAHFKFQTIQYQVMELVQAP